MAFRFELPERSIEDNVCRAARAEFDHAISELGEAGFEIHETVRNVRRRLKRVRAILRLIRPVFSDYAAENAALRDIGAEHSRLRDAMAVVEAVDGLLAGRRSRADAAAFGRLRHVLAERASDAEAALDRDLILADLRIQLRDARVRSELWTLRSQGPKAIVPGFVETYRRARRALRQVDAKPREAAFHEWRKRVKYHAAQLSLLRGLSPEFAEARRQRAQQLAAALGNFQNLSILKAAIDRDAALIQQSDRSLIESGIDDAVARLAARSLALGRAVFAESGMIVGRRWRGYVEDWRAAAKLAQLKGGARKRI